MEQNGNKSRGFRKHVLSRQSVNVSQVLAIHVAGKMKCSIYRGDFKVERGDSLVAEETHLWNNPGVSHKEDRSSSLNKCFHAPRKQKLSSNLWDLPPYGCSSSTCAIISSSVRSRSTNSHLSSPRLLLFLPGKLKNGPRKVSQTNSWGISLQFFQHWRTCEWIPTLWYWLGVDAAAISLRCTQSPVLMTAQPLRTSECPLSPSRCFCKTMDSVTKKPSYTYHKKNLLFLLFFFFLTVCCSQ